MKKCFILLFFTLQIHSYASQLLIGLNSRNIISWDVWENTNGNLEHWLFIYTYRSTEEDTQVEIKLKKFKDKDPSFEIIKSDTLAHRIIYRDASLEEIKTDTLLYKIFVKPNQFIKLPYPKNPAKLAYMEYFENGRSIGILPFNSNKPNKSFIKKKYKFYSNSSINHGPGMLWIRFESIYNTKTQIGITANLQYKKDYFLIKIVSNEKDGELFWTKLFTLQKSDKSIVKIDKLNKVYSFKLQRDFEQEKPVIFTIIGEHIEELEFFENQNGKRVKVKEMRWTGTCGGEFPIFFK